MTLQGISKGGLKLTKSSRIRLDRWLKRYEGKGVILKIKEDKPIRSLRANGYYWLILKIFADETGYGSVEELHTWLKVCYKRDSGMDIEEKEISTAEMDTQEFTEYIEYVRYQASECGVYLPEPNEGRAG